MRELRRGSRSSGRPTPCNRPGSRSGRAPPSTSWRSTSSWRMRDAPPRTHRRRPARWRAIAAATNRRRRAGDSLAPAVSLPTVTEWSATGAQCKRAGITGVKAWSAPGRVPEASATLALVWGDTMQMRRFFRRLFLLPFLCVMLAVPAGFTVSPASAGPALSLFIGSILTVEGHAGIRTVEVPVTLRHRRRAPSRFITARRRRASTSTCGAARARWSSHLTTRRASHPS